MADYDIHASVDPPVRRVTLGNDATFSCMVSGNDVGNVSIGYNWVAHHTVIQEKRFLITDDGQSFHILRTSSAENNTDVTCNVLSSESKMKISSDKSLLLVMPPIENVPQLTTVPQHESSTQRSSPAKTTASLHTKAPTESVGKTSQTAPGLGGLDTTMIACIIAGAVALLIILIVIIVATIICCRKNKKKRLERQASLSGRNRYSPGALKMKSYKFHDYRRDADMVFSETDGFTPKKHNQDILGNSQNKFSSKTKATKNGFTNSNGSLGNSRIKNVVLDRHEVIENEPASTDILIENHDNKNDTTNFDKTTNTKNTNNNMSSDQTEYMKLEPQNSSISSEDSLNQTTGTIFLADIHENSRTYETKC